MIGDPEKIRIIMKSYYVYVLASGKNGTLYIGVTNDLMRRSQEHKLRSMNSFTKKYQVDQLVYYEVFERIEDAITREKQLKKWNRVWKIRLVEENNPNWRVLSEGWK